MARYEHDNGNLPHRRRVRSPGTPDKIVDRIQLLRIGGKSVSEIEGQLALDVVEDGGPLSGLPVPALRTISKYARTVSPPDPSGEWSLLDEDEDDAALVLPVLAELLSMDRTLRLTNAEADLLVTIGRATAGRLPLIERLRFARLYLAAKEGGRDTREIDRRLAGWPGGSLEQAVSAYYRSDDMSNSYDRAKAAGEIYDREWYEAAKGTGRRRITWAETGEVTGEDPE